MDFCALFYKKLAYLLQELFHSYQAHYILIFPRYNMKNPIVFESSISWMEFLNQILLFLFHQEFLRMKNVNRNLYHIYQKKSLYQCKSNFPAVLHLQQYYFPAKNHFPLDRL